MDKLNIAFIIGAQRSGTTLLYRYMEMHPDICMATPLLPEPKFFLQKEYSTDWSNVYLQKHFSHLKHEKILVEKSTSYYEKENVANRIKFMLPESKIIVILRNPVDRALSNYFFTKSNGLETRSLQETFIENKPPPNMKKKISVNPFDYLERGNYLKYLKYYEKVFKKKNILYLQLENLILNHNTVLKNLTTFLEVNEFEFPALNHKINRTVKIENVSDEVYQAIKKYYKMTI